MPITDYGNSSFYIGGNTSTSSDQLFVVKLDRVFLQPRSPHTLMGSVSPIYSSYYTNDPTDTMLAWQTTPYLSVTQLMDDDTEILANPSANDASGILTNPNNSNGYPTESGFTTADYADLTVPNPPGYKYVSPGYSADAMGPLKMSGITLANYDQSTGTTITIPASAVSTAGVFITRPDVSITTGHGYIVNLGFAAGGNPNNFFGYDPSHPRNLITTGRILAGTYNLVLQASDSSNSVAPITHAITVVVTP